MPEKAKRTKNNHYEPQAKLKQFGKKQKGKYYLSVYDKKKDEFRHNQHTSTIGSENDLYRTLDKRNFNRIEDNFTKLENSYNSLFLENCSTFTYIIDSNKYRDDTKKAMSYLSTSLFRTPLVSKDFIEYMDVCIKYLNRIHKPLNTMLDTKHSRDLYFDDLIVNMPQHVIEHFSIKPSKILWIPSIDNRHYCTSDQPVIQFADGFPLPGENVYSNIDAIFVSITREKAFAVFHEDKEAIYFEKFNNPNYVNDSFILTSNREVYYHPSDHWYYKSRIERLREIGSLNNFEIYEKAILARKQYAIIYRDNKTNDIVSCYEMGLTPIWKDNNGAYMFAPEQVRMLYNILGKVDTVVDFMLEVSKIEDRRAKKALVDEIKSYLIAWNAMSQIFKKLLEKESKAHLSG